LTKIKARRTGVPALTVEEQLPVIVCAPRTKILGIETKSYLATPNNLSTACMTGTCGRPFGCGSSCRCCGSAGWARQRDYSAKGTAKGLVRLTLETADGTSKVLLSPAQAERLAADTLSARFDLPTLIVNRPKAANEDTTSLHHLSFRAESGGKRPYPSEETLKEAERHNPEIRATLAKMQERWDRRARAKQAKALGTGPGLFPPDE
jgi:hypothetical protein